MTEFEDIKPAEDAGSEETYEPPAVLASYAIEELQRRAALATTPLPL